MLAATVSDLLDTLRRALADRYAVERELGRGGMATVFLAEDLKHHRAVAIKVLHQELSAALGSDRFLREIEIAARLQHPHILPLYDSGSAEGLLYYVMPYVEGESLRDRLNREKQLPLDDAVRIATEVAGALAYAHSRGIVHRDVKPENIMLSAGTAVVADFGIARAVTAAGAGRQLTQTGTIIGTPAYMSPEQATGGGAGVDGRSDQYSLACVVYEMLVGEPPFTGPTAQAVIARHSLDMVSPPSIVRATIPDAVEAAVLRALAKVPADRYATTTLFAEGLNVPSAATGAVRRATLGRGMARPRPWLGRLLLPLGAVVVIAAGYLIVRARRPGGEGAAQAGGLDPRHVAVLYFADESKQHDLGYLADGLTESLIDGLSAVPTLDLVTRNGVAAYRNTTLARDSIARALSVGSLVEGSVEPLGTRLRVTVRLVDGASGADLQRATFEQPTASLLTVRDSLAEVVARFLRRRLGEEVRLREQRGGTHRVAAWSLLQQAEKARKDAERLFRADSGEAAARAFRAADSLAAEAQAVDPHWVDPLVLRARVAYRQARFDINPLHAAPWIDKGLVFAQQALELNPRSAEALELRGTLRYWRYLLRLGRPGELPELLKLAEGDLRSAVGLEPDLASAWSTLSHLNYEKPDYVEAKIDAQRAYEADAYLSVADQVLWRLYATSYDLEQFADALHWCDEGRRRFPGNPQFGDCQLWLMTTPARPADAAQAWQLFGEMAQQTPAAQWKVNRLREEIAVAAVLARAGLKDSARHVLARSKAPAQIDPEGELLSLQAFAYLLLGDKETALRLLSEQVAANPAHRVGLARTFHWWWRDLRDDPRFQALASTRK
jgi:serine/threonine-protein kinase